MEDLRIVNLSLPRYGKDFTRKSGVFSNLPPQAVPPLYQEGKIGIESTPLIKGDAEGRGICKCRICNCALFTYNFCVYDIVFMMVFQRNYNQDLPYIPYNSSNKDYARFNRKNQTKAESLIWNFVLKWDKTGYRFVRQKTLWWFIADFYCSKLLLVVEVDWWYHYERWVEDENREIWMKSKWIRTVRFTNNDVEKNMEWVIQYLEDIIRDRKEELWL